MIVEAKRGRVGVYRRIQVRDKSPCLPDFVWTSAISTKNVVLGVVLWIMRLAYV